MLKELKGMNLAQFLRMRMLDILEEAEEARANQIGEVLTNDGLSRDVYAIAKFYDAEDAWTEVASKIMFDGRLRRTGGNVHYRYYRNSRKRKFCSLKVNPKIPTSREGINQYFQIIQHELAHIITRASDDDQKFIDFCKKHHIHLSHDVDFDRYKIYCTHCETILGGFVHKTKTVKSIMNGQKRYTCSHCGSPELIIKQKH